MLTIQSQDATEVFLSNGLISIEQTQSDEMTATIWLTQDAARQAALEIIRLVDEGEWSDESGDTQ